MVGTLVWAGNSPSFHVPRADPHSLKSVASSLSSLLLSKTFVTEPEAQGLASSHSWLPVWKRFKTEPKALDFSLQSESVSTSGASAAFVRVMSGFVVFLPVFTLAEVVAGTPKPLKTSGGNTAWTAWRSRE